MTTLTDVRTGRYAELAFILATVIGLAAASFHWAGLILGGVLVGLLSSSVRYAVVSGLTFGGLALALQAALMWWYGGLDAYLAGGVLLVLTVAIGFALPTLGAIGARAVVGDG